MILSVCRSTVIVLLLSSIQISRSQHFSSESWDSDGHSNHGNYGNSNHGPPFPRIRNSGPSKIFEWIGSRFSKLPSLLPRLPSFPKYEAPIHKMPNYHVVIPQPPNSHHTMDEFYGGPPEGFGGSEPQGFGGEEPQGFGGEEPQGSKGQDEFPSDYVPEGPPQQEHGSQGNFEHSNQGNEGVYEPGNHGNQVKSEQGNHGNYKEEPKYPSKGPQHSYNQIQGPPAGKPSDSPIEVFPSKMVVYEKESYPPQGHEGGAWKDVPPQNAHPAQIFAHAQNFVQQDSFASQQKVHQQQNYAPQQKVPQHQNYAPPAQNFVQQQNYPPPEQSYQQNFAASQQNFAASQQNFAPPAKSKEAAGQGSKGPLKQVPFTPQSTGPDYFNTAYYHQNKGTTHIGTFQTDQASAIGAQAPSFGSFGDAFSSALNPANGGSSGVDITNQDLSSLLAASDQSNFNPYAHLDYPAAQPTNQQFQAAPPGGAQSSYIPLSPGVKVLQSQDSGNPAFEIIADANAPTYNGHPFDINKLISMIEPGAQLVEPPRPSYDASQAGSENVRVLAKPDSGNSRSPSSEKTTKTGSSDFYLSGDRATNPPLKVDLDPSPLKTDDLDPPPLKSGDLDSKSTNLKDLVTFFQQTDGKGYVVVEKKGPRDPTDLDLVDLDTKNDLVEDETEGTRLNVTADTFKYLFNLREQEIKGAAAVAHARDKMNQSNSSFSEYHPNHEDKSQEFGLAGDLDFADSNVRSVAITVAPPTSLKTKPIRNFNQSTAATPTSAKSKVATPTPAKFKILSESMTSSVSSSKARPAPVYNKKIKTPTST